MLVLSDMKNARAEYPTSRIPFGMCLFQAYDRMKRFLLN